MRRSLAHRGPDGFGLWQENDVSLVHWRLSIIDPSAAGRQPMLSHDARFVLSYNGEVYNFPELRAAIEEQWERGVAPDPPLGSTGSRAVRRWRGRSDTEVVLEGFAQWGTDCLSRLNGMFALALYDRKTGKLHLARDRAGVKPLYVWQRGGLLLFASEAKFFFFAQGFSAQLDAKGLAAFLSYGQCHGENHVLADVRQLEPGEVLTFERGGPDSRSLAVVRSRLAPRPRWRPVPRSDGDAVATLRQLLTDVVARQLVADVPVGVLLSGGVDSSILTALTARHMGPANTHAFTLGYPNMGADYDEIAHARRVARHLGVEHHVYQASESDVVAELERLVWHYDEPFADAAALNVFVLSRMIRSRVTVALAGEGSDELFGGYRRYHVEKIIRALGPLGAGACRAVRAGGLDRIGWMPRRVQVLLRAMARRGAAARYSSYLESDVPFDAVLRPEWRTPIGIHPAIQDGYPDKLDGGPVGHLCIVDQRFWLPAMYLEKSDKGGMAHGLEIRVPFLDNEVVDFANSLPDAQRIRGRARKWLLRETFGDMLPAEVFHRFKRGFGVPVSRWLRRELRQYYADQVLSPEARVRRYLLVPQLEACFREHLRGARDHSGLLWRCLVLEMWLRQFEGGFRRAGVSGDESETRAASESGVPAA